METLRQNEASIMKWLGDSRIKVGRTEAFKAEFSESVGYGYNKADQYFESINKVNVVLVRTEQGFKVLTSHPLVNKVK